MPNIRLHDPKSPASSGAVDPGSGPDPDPEGYESMTKAQIYALLDERCIDYDPEMNKARLIALLRAG